MGYQKLILSRKMTPVALLLLVASVSGFEDGSTQKEKDLTKLRSLVLGRQATGDDKCNRPQFGCLMPYDLYHNVDCDDDGILDHACSSINDQKWQKWLILSSEGCPNNWGTGSRDSSDCPAAFQQDIIPDKLGKLQQKIGYICYKQCMEVWLKTWFPNRTKTDECRKQCSFS